MTTISVCFTNFGPYHLARLRALAYRLATTGDRLLAIEVADQEQRYPWSRAAGSEPFQWSTLFPGTALETISREQCVRAMRRLLEAERPDALGIVGYARPESMAALNWARKNGRPTILMSESQEIDHPRTWWKEAVKRRRVTRFSSGLVGGPRHRDYLVKLGMARSRIALGYNAVDNAAFAARAEAARRSTDARRGLPERPYFLAINRFVPEKNLNRLVEAFARYRLDAPTGHAWDLVLCGDGPGAVDVERAIRASGVAEAIHRPGFLQVEELAPWLAFASAFVHPSLMEPWGLVVNEAAACGLPLLVSDRAGCVETLVPDPPGTTGRRFDPRDELELTSALAWISGLPESERRSMGQNAAEVVGRWGPERFAEGTVEALALAGLPQARSSVGSAIADLLVPTPAGRSAIADPTYDRGARS
jgi:1,2-diacylglycerol 3-alpha-glucosyltransferase